MECCAYYCGSIVNELYKSSIVLPTDTNRILCRLLGVEICAYASLLLSLSMSSCCLSAILESDSYWRTYLRQRSH